MYLPISYKQVIETFTFPTENSLSEFISLLPLLRVVREKRFIPWECASTAQVNLTETVNIIIKILYIKLIGFVVH